MTKAFPILVLAGAVILGLLIAGYGFVKLPSGALFSFKGAIFIFAPVFFTIVCIGCLFLPHEWRTLIAIIMITSFFSIYAAEFWLDHKDISKADVVSDLRYKKINAYPAILPNDFVQATSRSRKLTLKIGGKTIIPLSGIPESHTVLCKEGAGWITYNSDSYGFRNQRGIWENDTFNIAAIGDSFTQGHCVDEKNHIVAHIRDRLGKTINLGFGGNGPLLELATLKEYAAPKKPRLVLWFFTDSNDMGNLAAERKIDILMRYLEPEFSQGLINRKNDLSRTLKKIADDALTEVKRTWLKDRLFLRMLRFSLQLTNQAAPDNKSAAMTHPFDLFRQVLAEAKRSVEQWQGQFLFVYLPSRHTLIGKNQNIMNIRRNVLTSLKELGIDTIDTYPALSTYPQPALLFPKGFGHFNEAGYAFIAKEILKQLQSRSLAPK
jgi:hypothetical protein